MSDRRETGMPAQRNDENCVRCGKKIQGLQIDAGRGVYRTIYVEPGTRIEHKCSNTRGQR